MASDQKAPVRVFVAMPGTDLGPAAIWKDPRDVRSFYEKMGEALAERLDRPVDVIVEREKTEAGVIHRSMFREAFDADVFLADLTGNNPNVFLELGVRYALRRHVTIPVSQHTARLPFNIEHVRAVEYANRPDDIAIAKIVDLIVSGLESRHNDSPVRDVLDVEVVDRALWQKVSGARAAALLRAAESEERPDERVRILREAVEASPEAVDLRIRLALALRKVGSYTSALKVLEEGIRLDATRGEFFQERGLNLGKRGEPGDLQAAADALRQAVRLEPENQNFLANLGGAVRRLAMLPAPAVYDEELLREALEYYLAASRLAPYDTYPALNVVRLRLLLCRFHEDERQLALECLRRLEHLCAYQAAEHPDDCWRAFDYADVLLLLSKIQAGHDEYGRGIALVPEEERGNVLSSPLSALIELRDADVLSMPVRDGVEEAVRRIEAARKATGANIPLENPGVE